MWFINILNIQANEIKNIRCFFNTQVHEFSCKLSTDHLDREYKNTSGKNHFSEMKGDVGMSPHEKEGKQEHAYAHTKTGSH